MKRVSGIVMTRKNSAAPVTGDRLKYLFFEQLRVVQHLGDADDRHERGVLLQPTKSLSSGGMIRRTAWGMTT